MDTRNFILFCVTLSSLTCIASTRQSRRFNFAELTKPSCGTFPTSPNTVDSNWQVWTYSSHTFHFFRAYYDDRDASEPVVRILAYLDRHEPKVLPFCQFWNSNESQAENVQVTNLDILSTYPKDKTEMNPFLITCPTPTADSKPKFVSVAASICGTANNIMPVYYSDREYKGKFLVAVEENIFISDSSLQMAEWIEINKLLGADHFEFIVSEAHEKVRQVLRHYQRQGLVTVTDVKVPKKALRPRDKGWEYWANRMVPVHDSIYRNLYKYDFVVPLRMPYLLIPKRDDDRTWTDLLARVTANATDEFEVYAGRSLHFILDSPRKDDTFRGIPKKLNYLPNVYRASAVDAMNNWCRAFVRLDRILKVRVSMNPSGDSFDCLPRQECRKMFMDVEDGYTAVYFDSCSFDECNKSRANPVNDTTLWRYKDEVLDGVYAVQDELLKEDIHRKMMGTS